MSKNPTDGFNSVIFRFALPLTSFLVHMSSFNGGMWFHDDVPHHAIVFRETYGTSLSLSVWSLWWSPLRWCTAWSILGGSASAVKQCRLGLLPSSTLLQRLIVGTSQLNRVNHHVTSYTPMLFNLAAWCRRFMFVHGRLHYLVLEQRRVQVGERSYEAAKGLRSRSDEFHRIEDPYL